LKEEKEIIEVVKEQKKAEDAQEMFQEILQQQQVLGEAKETVVLEGM